jgi:hypothetical protein
MAKVSFDVPKSIRREIPVRTGSQMESHYIFGHNPRKQAYTSEEGVRGIPEFGVKRRPTKAGLHSSTAPLKTELQHFDSKHGFAGGFGGTGMTEES